MKKILLIILIIVVVQTTKAQVAGNKYKGVMNIPSPIEVVLNFTKDTVYMINVQEGIDMPVNSVLETMTYTINGNILNLKKTSGFSPCDNDIIGKYKLLTVDDKIYITVIEDACTGRSYAWTKEGMVKVK